MLKHFIGEDTLLGIAVEHGQHELLEELSLFLSKPISIVNACVLSNHHVF
jgi:hypothetical protein